MYETEAEYEREREAENERERQVYDYNQKTKVFERETKKESADRLEEYIRTNQIVQINSHYTSSGLHDFLDDTVLTGRLIGVIHGEIRDWDPEYDSKIFKKQLRQIYLFLPDQKEYRLSVKKARHTTRIGEELLERQGNFKFIRPSKIRYHGVKLLSDYLEVHDKYAKKIIPLNDTRINYLKLTEGLNYDEVSHKTPISKALLNDSAIKEISSFMEPAYSSYTDTTKDPKIPEDILKPVKKEPIQKLPTEEKKKRCSGNNCVISGGRKKTNKRKNPNKKKKTNKQKHKTRR